MDNVIWSNICYPEDLSELLVDIEDMDVTEPKLMTTFLEMNLKKKIFVYQEQTINRSLLNNLTDSILVQGIQ